MHRLFVQRHGWHVKGVAPGGGSWMPTSSALGLGDRLPARLRDLVEEKFGEEDFSLDELSLLAATIEALIHSEAVGRLHATYKAMDKDPQVSLNKDEANSIIYSCMTAYLAGYNISQLTAAQLESTRKSVEDDYPYWKHTKSLIEDSQQQVAPNVTQYDFSTVEQVLEVVSENMGHRVDEGNCQDIEDRLVAIEESPSSGRVKLADFYSSHLNDGNWQFQERPEYLRQLGVLDESEPTTPRVMIPNYLIMQANCLNVSSYYDLCCIDLCEDLLDKLEVEIRGPQASPAEIARIVTQMESAYVPAGRTLSAALVNKLEEVAKHHGGSVPLHGRLFAQWMHFAYPIECPFPHVSGTTKLQTDTEWFAETGIRSWATKSEMQTFINGTPRIVERPACDDSEDGMCLWQPEEELVDAVSWQALASAEPAWVTVRSSLRACALVAVILSSGMAMRSIFQQLQPILYTVGWGKTLFSAVRGHDKVKSESISV